MTKIMRKHSNYSSDARLNKSRLIRFQLQLTASILLTSVCASGWPYHEIVGVAQSATPVFVAPVYGVAPAVSLLDPEKEAETVVAGPVTGTTIVEGSSSGPVTIVSPGSVSETPVNPPPPTLSNLLFKLVDEDAVLIKGASAGPVTLVAPSDNHAIDNALSAPAETKKGAVATSAQAGVAIENAEVSSAATASANVTVVSETIGVATAKAVIGPSTGPIIIRGPTAPPLPTTVAVTTPATVATSTSASVSVASSAVANASISSTVEEEKRPDAAGKSLKSFETTILKSSASSSASVTQNSGNSVVSATAGVNLITSPVVEAPLSNVVVSAPPIPSAVVSGPSGSISRAAASVLLLKAPL
ncbi:uncharacterized protein LOC143182049 [Calliopsis andreniformis]|uniref:uncharacterized protein LOC143182049 n=1 Tax=Calliopsis andreniformis TaxID=337506 RepID=UPI003FCE0013